MKLFSLYYKKCYGTAGVDYLKLKNDVTYWKTVIPDGNQFHAAPNFLLLSS